MEQSKTRWELVTVLIIKTSMVSCYETSTRHWSDISTNLISAITSAVPPYLPSENLNRIISPVSRIPSSYFVQRRFCHHITFY